MIWSRCRDNVSVGSNAMMVALRGAGEITASSPKDSPGPMIRSVGGVTERCRNPDSHMASVEQVKSVTGIALLEDDLTAGEAHACEPYPVPHVFGPPRSRRTAPTSPCVLHHDRVGREAFAAFTEHLSDLVRVPRPRSRLATKRWGHGGDCSRVRL